MQVGKLCIGNSNNTSFCIDDYEWKMDHKEFGAGAIIIIMLYNNHIIIKTQSQLKLA